MQKRVPKRIRTRMYEGTVRVDAKRPLRDLWEGGVVREEGGGIRNPSQAWSPLGGGRLRQPAGEYRGAMRVHQPSFWREAALGVRGGGPRCKGGGGSKDANSEIGRVNRQFTNSLSGGLAPTAGRVRQNTREDRSC